MQELVSELNRIRNSRLVSAYAIGGAVAANIYLEPSATLDVDVFVTLDAGAHHGVDDLGPVYADLVAHGAKWDGPYLVVGGWHLQLLGQGSPLDQDAVLHAVDHPFGDEAGKIMTAHHVAAISLATLRPEKDIGRVSGLLRSKQLDRFAFDALVERFGLRKQWAKYETIMTDA